MNENKKSGKKIIMAAVSVFVAVGIISLVFIPGSYNSISGADNSLNEIIRKEAPKFEMILSSEYSYDEAHDIPEEGYELVGQTHVLNLFYNFEENSLYVIDRRNGFRWGNPKDFDTEEDFGGNAYLALISKTLFQYEYFFVRSRRPANEINLSSLIEESFMDIEREDIENGIRMAFDLKDKEIVITLEFYVQDDQFIVNIPDDGIDEYGEFRLVSINALPFFGAASDREQGYVFYPDGSGAITEFKEEHPRYFNFFQGFVYGRDFGSEAINIPRKLFDGEMPVMMPVFGVKKSDNAFISIIEEGDHNSVIEFRPSGFRTNINYVSARHTFRRPYQAHLDNASPIRRMESDFYPGDRKQSYTFLIDEWANYSGMANTYRNFLIDKLEITIREDKKESMPLLLEILCGIEEPRLIGNSLVAMSTYDEVSDMLLKANDLGIDNMIVNLLGWSDLGYMKYPSEFNPLRALGGRRDLRQLISVARENDIALLLQSNITDVVSGQGSYSRNDLAIQGNRLLPLTDRFNRNHLFSPGHAYEVINEKLIDKYARFDGNGVTYEKLGQYLYRDFGRRYGYIGRHQTAEYFREIVKEAGNNFSHVAIRGGSEYMIGAADIMMEIPQSCSGFFFSDRSVPFYQMVVHGLASYSGTPINLFYDYDKQILEQIEFGSIPSFILTEKSAQELMHTDFNVLYSSEFDKHIEHAKNIYSEINRDLGHKHSSYMIFHEVLDNGIVRTLYNDGTEVYINYGAISLEVQGNIVPARGYLVVKGE